MQKSGIKTASEDNGPYWKPDTTTEFEVGAQLRPWTIHDEGMTYILDNMQTICGVNNVYLIVVMHQEHRPFKSPEFPHNPARDIFDAEDSRVSFFPDWERYGSIKPLLSDYDWINRTDWLQLVVDSCRARGLGVGAEVSHFPIPQELVSQHPEWHQKTIDGKSWRASRFCPNNPEVRQYLLALFGDLAANYDLDYIQTCLRLFNNREISQGGTCFCEHCRERARRAGFDLEAAIPVLKENPNAEPERTKWIELRKNSTTEIIRLIAEKIREENPDCHLRYNDDVPFAWRTDPSPFGLYLQDVAPYLGSMVNADHEEQLGDTNETFDNRIAWLERSRAYLGPDKPLLSGIATRIDAYPELIREGIRVAVRHPANINGLAMKHYDGASFSLMRAFKQGMIDAGVCGLKPTLGWEVEEMELDGYRAFDQELVEEWGVQTEGAGTARKNFDKPSGRYYIRITYFDQENGSSPVSLQIEGEEAAAFRMDEDTDCWRWRMFKDIRIRKGYQITLSGMADGEERAILDFIEFIPYQ